MVSPLTAPRKQPLYCLLLPPVFPLHSSKTQLALTHVLQNHTDLAKSICLATAGHLLLSFHMLSCNEWT